VPPVGDRDAALIQNQQEFKRANERLEHAVAGLVAPDRRVPFVCECLDVTCTGDVAMTISEYRTMRRHEQRFAIIPGHPTLDSERIVDENDRYQLVEKPDDQP
jgi:hypothetical protein